MYLMTIRDSTRQSCTTIGQVFKTSDIAELGAAFPALACGSTERPWPCACRPAK